VRLTTNFTRRDAGLEIQLEPKLGGIGEEPSLKMSVKSDGVTKVISNDPFNYGHIIDFDVNSGGTELTVIALKTKPDGKRQVVRYKSGFNYSNGEIIPVPSGSPAEKVLTTKELEELGILVDLKAFAPPAAKAPVKMPSVESSQ
jgi:hypothetical protein